MEVLHSRCCGLDVHKKSISACVMIREHGTLQKLERRFGTFTGELEDMATWLEVRWTPKVGQNFAVS